MLIFFVPLFFLFFPWLWLICVPIWPEGQAPRPCGTWRFGVTARRSRFHTRYVGIYPPFGHNFEQLSRIRHEATSKTDSLRVLAHACERLGVRAERRDHNRRVWTARRDDSLNRQ